MGELHAVTGAFGFSGKYIARALLARGVAVRTLTNHPRRPHATEPAIEVAPLDFSRPQQLTESLRGVRVLHNTYWVRFSRGDTTHAAAIENTRTLIAAAERAGVERIVHISITNPSETSPLPYFRGKAVLERLVRESSLSHAVLRPAAIFGPEDVLINNIAWLLRRSPVFVVPGTGRYRLQPIFAGDLAQLAVAAAARTGDETIDAIGPETFTFNELLAAIRASVRSRARLVHAPALIALQLSRIIGRAVRDVVLTREEVDGLLAGLLATSSAPAGSTRLTDWLRDNRDTVGRRWASELALHYR